MDKKRIREPRPDIPKVEIVKIGVIEDGKPHGWEFNGSLHPGSVAYHFSEDWYLIGGYTVDELRAIASGARTMNKQRAAELLPIIQAFAEGKEIQHGFEGQDGEMIWTDGNNPDFNSGFVWRMKPEPLVLYVNVYDEDNMVSYTTSREATRFVEEGAIRVAVKMVEAE